MTAYKNREMLGNSRISAAVCPQTFISFRDVFYSVTEVTTEFRVAFVFTSQMIIVTHVHYNVYRLIKFRQRHLNVST